MDRKFDGMPVIIAHFDKDLNIINEECYNLENIEMDNWQIEMFARAILPDIQKYYENEENVRAFEAWQREQEQKLTTRTDLPQKRGERK